MQYISESYMFNYFTSLIEALMPKLHLVNVEFVVNYLICCWVA